MARSVRKVSRVSTKNQQKEKILSKKWWIIISSVIAAIIIGVGVGLGIYYATLEEEYVSDKIYFAEPVEISEGVEVEFTKENYQSLVRYLKAEKVEHLLVFVYDGAAFYGDSLDEENYDKRYTTIVERLANLQAEVNSAKAAGISIELYIVDVNVDSRVNADIMYDSTYFGGLYTESQETFQPAFIYNHEGEYQSTVEISERDMTISTSSLDTILNSSISNAINYIKSLN